MTRNAKQAFSKSKTEGKLDPKKIRNILPKLTRLELRDYLLLLKQERNREKVIVEVPITQSLLGSQMVDFFKKKFPGKELEFIKNKNLIGGLRIQANDQVLDLSIKKILESLYA